MNKMIYLSLAAVLLNGCVSQDYLDVKADTQSIHDEINIARNKSSNHQTMQSLPLAGTDVSTRTLSNVSVLDKPPAMPAPIKRDTTPPWLKQRIRTKATNLPLSLVLAKIVDGKDIDVTFDSSVNPNIPVTINKQGTRKSILNMLNSLTRYQIDVENENTIHVSYYQSETFMLDIPSGTYSGQQGEESSAGDSDSEGGDPKVEGQFLKVSYDSVDVVSQVAEAVKALLNDETSDDDEELIGDVKVVPSLAAITVRTTPDRMQQVRELVETYQQELNHQVLLDVRVLEFRSNLGKDRGVDWNLVKKAGSGSLNFIIPGTSSSAGMMAGSSGLAFTGSGDLDGTTAFIKALEEQGTVSTDTPISVLTLSSHPARISQTVTTPYLSDISTEVTDTTTSTSTTRGKVVEGIDMMVNTNVKDDFVWIRTAGKLSKIANDAREKVADEQLRFIGTRDADLSFTNKLGYGQTVVIGSVKQQTKTTGRSSSFGIDGLGSQVTNLETVETLVLLTPRRVQ